MRSKSAWRTPRCNSSRCIPAIDRSLARCPPGPARSAACWLPGSSRRCLAAQETLPTVHRPALCGLKWNSCLPPALRTNRHGFHLAGRRWPALPFAFTGFTALGLVLEILIEEEMLFPRGENKFRSAIRTLQNSILELRHNPGSLAWVAADRYPPCP